MHDEYGQKIHAMHDPKRKHGMMDGSNCADCGCALTVAIKTECIVRNPTTGVSERISCYMCAPCIGVMSEADHSTPMIPADKIELGENGKSARGIVVPKPVLRAPSPPPAPARPPAPAPAPAPSA